MARARLQQARSRLTRRSIIEAAEALWAERDFDSVSVEDVCQRAGVAKGTFYFYFPRKEHLLVMTVFGRFLPKDAEIQGLLDSPQHTVTALTQLQTGIGERVKTLDNRLVLRAVEESFRHFRHIGRLEGGDRSLHAVYDPFFKRAVARGEVRTDWHLDTASRALAWATLQEIFLWGKEEVPEVKFLPNLRQRAELILAGVAAEKPEVGRAPRRVKVASAG